jgi:hypothetical protein
MTQFLNWRLQDNKIISGNTLIPLDSVSYVGYLAEENPNKMKFLIAGGGIILAGLVSFAIQALMAIVLIAIGAGLIFLALQVTEEYRLYSQSGAFLHIKEVGGSGTSQLSKFNEFASEVIAMRDLYIKSLHS